MEDQPEGAESDDHRSNDVSFGWHQMARANSGQPAGEVARKLEQRERDGVDEIIMEGLGVKWPTSRLRRFGTKVMKISRDERG
jgi:hypothetical protein